MKDNSQKDPKDLINFLETGKNPKNAIQDAFMEFLFKVASPTSYKGDKGDSPEKGIDYYTPEEVEQIKREVTPVKGQDYLTDEELEQIRQQSMPVKGEHYFTREDIDQIKGEVLQDATPVKGVHYFDGEDGRDGRDGKDGKDGRDGRDVRKEEVIAEIMKSLPIPKDGKNPEVKEVVKAVLDTLKSLKGNDRLPLSAISGSEFLKKLDMNDQRWHGGGISGIRDEGVAIGPTGQGVTTLDFIGAGVTVSYTANGVAVISIPGGAGNPVNNETPVGAIDGINTSYTLAHIPVNNSLMLYLNGQLLTVTEDYTIVGAAISLINAPMSGGVLRAFYQY